MNQQYNPHDYVVRQGSILSGWCVAMSVLLVVVAI